MPENKVQITIEATDNTKAAYQQASNSVKGLVDNLKAHWLALSASAAATLLAIERTISWAKGIANAANEIDRNSKSLNLSTDAYQQWTYAAKMADVGQEEFLIGLKLLSRNMDDASRGSGDAAKRFQAMGISVKDASGNLRPLDDVMLDIMEKFSSWEDGPRKIAIALDLFGRSGERMVPFLNKGKSGFEELSKEARIVSKDVIDAGSKAEDAFKRLSDNADKFKLSLSPLALLLADILEKLSKLSTKSLGFTQEPDYGGRKEAAELNRQLALKLGIAGTAEQVRELAKKYVPSTAGAEEARYIGKIPTVPVMPKSHPPAMPDEEALKLEQKLLEENAKAWGDYAQEILDSLEKMHLDKVEEAKAAIAEDSKAEQTAIEEDARAWGVYADSVLDALEKMHLDKVEEIKKGIEEASALEQKALEEDAKAWGEYADAVLNGLEKIQLMKNEETAKKLKESEQLFVQFGENISSVWAENTKGIISGATSMGEALKKIFTGMADVFISAIAKMAANWALFGSAKGEFKVGSGLLGLIAGLFSEGGVVLGWKPMKAFQEGGVAYGPTLGMIGEGGPEAFVPLKGGRIPVEMSGGGGQTTINYFDIKANDAPSFVDLCKRNPAGIIHVVGKSVNRNGPMRTVFK